MNPNLESSDSNLPVFVYGTLRPGEKNFAPFLGGRCQNILPASVPGRLYYVRGEGYPYLTEETGTVKGELIFIDPRTYRKTLRRLDQLEEYNPDDLDGSVYLRKQVTAIAADGLRHTAWTYIWNLVDLCGERIPSGDFSDRPRD